MDEVKVESVSLNDATKPAETESAMAENPAIAELNEKLATLNDKYLRTAAELENTRRRAILDSESRARARAMSVAEKILPVADAVDAALKHAPDDTGIQSLARAMESAFKQIGITKIESIGATMNPALHNAIQVAPAPENVAPNTIIEEMQPGYMFGENVLRTAMVVVAK
ncbi:MAG: nucleotide exchange factor GrpE [Alphaproteobacteria bacterium]|nr:nucleotide exchange factor GrpE [Alphaproteobacteria bacterium]